MALFQLILLVVMFLQSVDSTCGPPGSSVGADVFGHTSTAEEGQTISYKCKNAYKQVYGNVRECVRGKWTNRIPKCAIKESHNLKVDNYKVNYFDIQDSVGFNVNKTAEFLDYIKLNLSRRFIFQIHYSPKTRLSYIELDLQIQSEELPTDLKISLLINDYRDCVKSAQNLLKTNSVIEFKFICEAKTDIDYEIEGKDPPNSLRFSFESKNKFKSRIIRLSVFRFNEGCGSPDIPLNAKAIIDSGNIVSIYPSKPERYRIWGQEYYDTVRCLYEGNWDKEFHSLYPTISCPFDDSQFNSLNYKNITKEYFEYFNDTLFATVDSKIQFQCNDSHNSTDFHYIYCQGNGEWSGEINVCNEQVSNVSANGRPVDDSDFFVIIVTLVSTFVTTLTLVLIFGTIIVWRKKSNKKRRLKDLNIKYVKESEFENYSQILSNEISYSSGHYEAVDYQAIDLGNENRPKNNHYYMQILG